MRYAVSAGVLLCSGAALVMALSMAGGGAVQAQVREVWEYAYLIEVDRIDTYEGGIEAWNANRGDKDYYRAHMFAYEKGFHVNDRTLNRLKRINTLAEQGWALYEGDTGLLVRRR